MLCNFEPYPWFAMGIIYKMLPVDLIPDFIPLIGKLDDMVAGLMAGAGVATMWAGWHYGRDAQLALIGRDG